MVTLLILLHILVAVLLILVVLLQSGKAGDLASTFGGASSQTAFGPRGTATFLTKATTVLAVLFMLNSLALSILYTGTPGGSTVMEALPGPPAAEQPAGPPAPATGPATESSAPPEQTPPEDP